MTERCARADSEPGDVLAALRSGSEMPSRVLLRDESSGTGPLVSTRALGKPAAAGRYRVLGEIARGGVGVVMKSRDTMLGRDVAMKILREEHANNPAVVRRFVEEAQIGGQLQHPGIVPVYEMGMHPDSRPFFTMKLIKGRTLAALLGDREQPTDDLRHFLGIFESVCQTLAYAHARRVVHRDLKPGNVMVGTFGEVQVVDWGLGKVLRREESAATRSAVRPDGTLVSVRGAAQSVAGTIMGTPQYMPPEQAQGLVDATDERTDVFALGAILCEILTGAPPYAGTGVEAVMQSRKGDLSGARERLDACGADRVLVDLVVRCLAPAMEARPRGAGLVAKEVSHYLSSVEERERAGQLGAAQAAERTAQERRARRLTIGLAAAVLVACVTFGGVLVFAAVDRNEQLERVRRGARDATEAARRAHGRARSERSADGWREARRRSELAVEAAAATGDEGLLRASQSLASVAAAEETMAVAERDSAAGLSQFLERLDEIDIAAGLEDDRPLDPRFAAAFADHGLDLDAGPPEAAAERIGRSPAAARIVSALDAWARNRRAWGLPDARLRALVALVDPDAARTGIRAATGKGALRAMVPPEEAPLQDVGTAVLLGRALLERGADASSFASRIQRSFPGEFQVHVLHADAAAPSETNALVRDAGAIVALRENSPAAWTRLGDALLAHGSLREAEGALRRALRLDPRTAAAHVRLGEIAALRGDWDGALVASRDAVALAPDSSSARLGFGRALARRGRHSDALAETRRARELAAGRPAPPDAPDGDGSIERLAAAAERLDEFLAARTRPADASERLLFARACLDRGKFGRAADLYAAAFAEDPSLGLDFESEHRLDAACAAALAVPHVAAPTALDLSDASERRAQALAWLSADLAAWNDRFSNDTRFPASRVRRRFARWTDGPELAGVRDASLAAIPESERAAWNELWSGVRDLLERARD